MKLAVVIIHYNTSGDLDRCLDSLAACAPAAEHQVIVVDNASSEPGLEEVHRKQFNIIDPFAQRRHSQSRTT